MEQRAPMWPRTARHGHPPVIGADDKPYPYDINSASPGPGVQTAPLRAETARKPVRPSTSAEVADRRLLSVETLTGVEDDRIVVD